MSAFKIFEVANELNTTSDILMAICKKIGIKVKSNGSSIDEEQKNMVIAEFKSRSEKAEKKAPAKKTDVAVKAKPAKKTAAKKSSSSKIKWIKISESPGAAGEVKEDTEEQESAIDEQAAVSEVKETVKTAKTVKTPAKKTAGAAKSAESKPAGKKPEDLTDLKIKKKDSSVIKKEVLPGKTTAGADEDKVKPKTALTKEDKAAAEKNLEAEKASTPVKTEMAGGKKPPEHKEDVKAPKSKKVKKRPAQNAVYDGTDMQESAEEEDFVDIEEEKFIKKTLLKEKGADTFKVRQPWNEEKKINIKKVLDRELDKEEKEGRFRAKLKPAAKKYTAPERVSEKTGEKDTSKQQEKSGAKAIKRPEIKKIIEIPEGITIKQLSEKIGISSEEIIQSLFNLGEVFNINQLLDKDIIEILSNEFSFKYSIIDFDDSIDEMAQDSDKDLKPRPPIVTVMGHVDHGKTTLLDAIRKSDVASGEAGGITQSIGAYQAEYNGKKITFIDTPGHEAFTSMRARGARVTDIAIIVIAADDGIMPQTAEAINHAKDAGVTIIVAVNKIDLPEANPDKVKQGLTEYELVPEEWGGDTIFVNISAKNRQNIDELLEMILLVAEMNDIRGNPSIEGSGIIIESKLDKNLGAIGTVLIRRGRIKTGDCFVTGNSFGRIRTIKNDKGETVNSAEISQPVEISGFSIVPQAGDKFFIVKSEKVAKEIISKRQYQKQALRALETKKHITLEDLSGLSKENEIKKLKIVLKSESYGSLDAVEKALKDAEENNIKIEFIHKAVGAVSDSDILLASASDAIVIGFGVVATSKAKMLAKDENIEIRTYNIIYKLIDDIKLASKGLLEPVFEEKIKGNAEVREVFKISKVGIVAGSYILDGEVERGNSARLIRDGKIVFDGKVESLHRFKDDVKKVNAGYECGIRIENFQDINKGDLIEIYEQVEVPR
ncbi:MAG: translation initiation factor IF-2 [Actinobacteria bacterium]|nr:translation initiation factor IF-2 [Actinomycetota bacterium]